MKLRLGLKGEIVIPKKVREHLGITRENPVLLTVKEDSIELRASKEDILDRWEAMAKSKGVNSSKLLYGDELYEEVF